MGSGDRVALASTRGASHSCKSVDLLRGLEGAGPPRLGWSGLPPPRDAGRRPVCPEWEQGLALGSDSSAGLQGNRGGLWVPWS